MSQADKELQELVKQLFEVDADEVAIYHMMDEVMSK